MGRLFLISALLVFVFGCQSDPEEVLELAKKNINKSDYISYSYFSLWPDMMGENDTIAGTSQFKKKKNTFFDYDFISKRNKADITFMGDEYRQIIHGDSTVLVYSKNDIERLDMQLKDNMVTAYSPMVLLEAGEWQYKKDTSILDIQLFNYFSVETDTVIGDKNIYAERHLFINPTSALVERYERRLYHNGKKKQFISYIFSGYSIQNDTSEFTYSYPSHYLSKMISEKESIQLLEAGQPAPEFEVKDMEGKPIKLSDFRGQKVLIDFSMINCGWCKVALDEFNNKDFGFGEGITALYINPVDSKADMEKYLKKFNVPFPVIAEAKSIGKAYGVSGYPTFFLVDEQGVIEKVKAGYQEEFFSELKK